MHIPLDEAVSLLNTWKATGTVLKARLFRAGHAREVRGTVKDIKGTVINFYANGEEIAIDLDGAEFNGDRRSPPNSSHGAYLVCEYGNGEQFSFYAPRPGQEETGQQSNDRRRVL
jgi:hypothetical protein